MGWTNPQPPLGKKNTTLTNEKARACFHLGRLIRSSITPVNPIPAKKKKKKKKRRKTTNSTATQKQEEKGVWHALIRFNKIGKTIKSNPQRLIFRPKGVDGSAHFSAAMLLLQRSRDCGWDGAQSFDSEFSKAVNGGYTIPNKRWEWDCASTQAFQAVDLSQIETLVLQTDLFQSLWVEPLLVHQIRARSALLDQDLVSMEPIRLKNIHEKRRTG